MTGDDSVPCPVCDSSATHKLNEHITKYLPDDVEYRCTFCGNGFSSNESKAKVPIEELEALADAWEQQSETFNPHMTTDERATLDDCAQELREVIEEYE